MCLLILAVSACAANGQAPAWVEIEEKPGGTVIQSQSRVPTASNYLQAGWECQQRRDYEQAEILLRRAEAARHQLTSQQQRFLQDCLAANQTALAERRHARALYEHARVSVQAGRPQEARATLALLQNSPHLKPEERAEVQLWLQRLDNGMSGSRGESLLTEARRALRRGDFDRAEALARQADAVGPPSWLPWADSPQKLLREIEQARSLTAREFLRQARSAIRNGEATKARQLLAKAEALRPTLGWWDDLHPDKLRAELAALPGKDNLPEISRLPMPSEVAPAPPSAVGMQKVEQRPAPDAAVVQRSHEDLHREAAGQFDACLVIADTLQNQGRFQEAEQYLLHARDLALRFAWPTYAVNQRLMRLKALAEEAEQAVAQAPDEARNHLAAIEKEAQAGRLDEARKLAEALYTAPYGLKLHASSWLARLDDYEFRGSRQDAERNYELAVQAFLHKDYHGAMLYLAGVNVRLLDDRRQAHAAELLRTLEALRAADKKTDGPSMAVSR